MAFTLTTFQFCRGVATAAINGAGVGTVIHGYKSTDTNATIVTAGYFPDNIDGSDDKIFVGDLLLIVSSDTVGIYKVTTLAPFALGADLFGGAGSPIIMSVPVAATDANGIKITGTTVQLEIADATHAGIVTELDQNFAGIKMFNSGAKFLTFGGTPTTLNYYEEYDHVTTFTNNTETTNSMTFKLVRTGTSVIILNTTVGSVAGQGAPLNRFTANTVLPARFRPAQELVNTWFVSNGGVYKVGAIRIAATGDIYIYDDPDLTTAFTAAQILTIGVSSIPYTV
jgi:hypothetical protein